MDNVILLRKEKFRFRKHRVMKNCSRVMENFSLIEVKS